MRRDKKYAQCFSQEEEMRNARYEKRGIMERRMYKRSFDRIISAEEGKG